MNLNLLACPAGLEEIFCIKRSAACRSPFSVTLAPQKPRDFSNNNEALLWSGVFYMLKCHEETEQHFTITCGVLMKVLVSLRKMRWRSCHPLPQILFSGCQPAVGRTSFSSLACLSLDFYSSGQIQTRAQ